MCAAPIESPDHLLGARMESPFPDEIPSSAIISGREPQTGKTPQAVAASGSGGIVCAACKGVNEADWVFCQYCGNRLPEQKASPPRPEPSALQPEASGPALSAKPQAPPPAPAAKVAVNAPPAAPLAVEAKPPANQAPSPKCSACGQPGSTGALYCAYCGKPMAPFAGAEQERSDVGGAIIQIISEGGQVGETWVVEKGGTSIGRVEGDATFPHDGYLSSRHAQIVAREGRYYLVDLDSRNGTFIRIRDEVELKPGDTFLVGKQLFKFSRK